MIDTINGTGSDDTLTIRDINGAALPDSFVLETRVRIEPDRNTQLSGLYRSKDGYFTQCEAQGFRRISFFPDRPDVMARFTCIVEAERERFPQLLSNGNRVASGDLDGARHRHGSGRRKGALRTCHLSRHRARFHRRW